MVLSWKISFVQMTKSLNTSDPSTANHHWFPFLRYVQECESKGKEASVNDWLISLGKVKDYKEEAKIRENKTKLTGNESKTDDSSKSK